MSNCNGVLAGNAASVSADGGALRLQSNSAADLSAKGMASVYGATSLQLGGGGGPVSMAAGDRFDVRAAGAVSVYSPLWATRVADTGIALTSAGEVVAAAGSRLQLASAGTLDASAPSSLSLYMGDSMLLNAENGPFSLYTLHEAFH